jgi:ABC-type cobalamin transport system permease subunit
VSSSRSESSVIVYSRVSRIATIHIVGKSMFATGATVNILVAPSSALTSPGTVGSGGMSAPMAAPMPQPVPPPVGMAQPGGPAPVRTQPLR